MQYFFLPSSVRKDNKICIDDKALLHQLSHVLRFTVGDKIKCLFNDGEEHIVELLEFSKKEILGEIVETQKNKNELLFQLTLVQALPKSKDKWEFIVQKATELGVSKIIPLQSSRSSAKYPADSDRIQKIIREAAEQSERGLLPKIKDVCTVETRLIASLHNSLLADSYDKNAPLLLDVIKNLQGDISIIIGPEGGFSEEEVEIFKKQGAKSVSLGKRVLRLETASVVSLGIISQLTK